MAKLLTNAHMLTVSPAAVLRPTARARLRGGLTSAIVGRARCGAARSYLLGGETVDALRPCGGIVEVDGDEVGHADPLPGYVPAPATTLDAALALGGARRRLRPSLITVCIFCAGFDLATASCLLLSLVAGVTLRGECVDLVRRVVVKGRYIHAIGVYGDCVHFFFSNQAGCL